MVTAVSKINTKTEIKWDYIHDSFVSTMKGVGYKDIEIFVPQNLKKVASGDPLEPSFGTYPASVIVSALDKSGKQVSFSTYVTVRLMNISGLSNSDLKLAKCSDENLKARLYIRDITGQGVSTEQEVTLRPKLGVSWRFTSAKSRSISVRHAPTSGTSGFAKRLLLNALKIEGANVSKIQLDTIDLPRILQDYWHSRKNGWNGYVSFHFKVSGQYRQNKFKNYPLRVSFEFKNVMDSKCRGLTARIEDESPRDPRRGPLPIFWHETNRYVDIPIKAELMLTSR